MKRFFDRKLSINHFNIMQNRPKKFLLIEDDLVDQMSIERIVKRGELPYQYKIVTTVADVKNILETEHFDFVIGDFQIEDGTLFDVLDLIVACEIPIIVLTGNGNLEIAVEALKRGASDYLVKDFERNYLKALPVTIEKVIKNKTTEQRLQELEGYIASLENTLGQQNNSVPSEDLGLDPLKEKYPDKFLEFTNQFERLLEQSLENKTFKPDVDCSKDLYALSKDLGSFNSGPRDAIDIYLSALKKKNDENPKPKIKEYAEEGRQLILELMGFLVSFYRSLAIQNQEK